MTMQIDTDLQAGFREAMAAVATPVSVVTTSTATGPHGATVSAFASLSMDPPMVLVALDRRSRLLEHLQQTRRFGLNILGAEQAELATRFAARAEGSRFEGVAWHEDAGLPRLEGAPAWLACRIADFVDGGDHLIALGEVNGAQTVPGLPLTYHRRLFGTHAVL